jgi:hypothetical protein
MNLYNKDYKKLCKMQNNFLAFSKRPSTNPGTEK